MRSIRGALAPLKTNLPLPLGKGKGIKGIGFPIKESRAERVGFEPTVAKGYTRSPGAPDRPLQHLSTNYSGSEIISFSMFTCSVVLTEMVGSLGS